MKKRISIISLVAAAIVLVGCNKTPQETESTQQVVYDFPVVVYDDIELQVGSSFADVKSKLGEALDIYESESCAGLGIERVYTYDGMIITTASEAEDSDSNDIDDFESSERIHSIQLLDDSVKMNHDIAIGSKAEDLIEVYGTPGKETNYAYHYYGENETVAFLLQKYQVISITVIEK